MYSAISIPEKEQSLNPEPLTPLYYLENFHQVLNSVEQLNGNWLPDRALKFLADFRRLSTEAQALQVRLYSRKGPLLRADRLNYPEVGPLDVALRELLNNDWIVRNPDAPVEDYLATLTRAEIVQWLCPGAKQARRSDLLGEICLDTPTLTKQVPLQFLFPLRQDTLQLFLDAFFANRHQDLSAFVVRELGHVRYPLQHSAPHSPRFKSLEELHQFQDIEDVADTLRNLRKDELIDPAALCYLAKQLPKPVPRSHLRFRADQIQIRIAREMERLGRQEEALKLYADALQTPARERRARLLFQQGDFLEAYHLCLQIEADPMDFSEEQFVRGFLPRCLKALKVAFEKPADWKPAERRLLNTNPELSPERRAIQALGGADGEWHYVENWLINAWLGLFFWEVIYLPLPGAFTQPFQLAPHDFYQPGFRQRRQKEIEVALSLLLSSKADSGLDRLITLRWQEHNGTANPLVRWAPNGLPLLRKAIRHIPARHWHAIARRWLGDIRMNSSGFPDLIQLRHDGSYLLAEVKGPGDQLRANQVAWLRYFAEQGIPAQVVHVD